MSKSVSDQLSAMGLSFGDLCEIEGVEGVCVVVKFVVSEDLFACDATGRSLAYGQRRVVRGWKMRGAAQCFKEGNFGGDRFLPTFVRIDPPADELPEGVRAARTKVAMRIHGGRPVDLADIQDELDDFARAILQAAKDK